MFILCSEKQKKSSGDSFFSNLNLLRSILPKYFYECLMQVIIYNKLYSIYLLSYRTFLQVVCVFFYSFVNLVRVSEIVLLFFFFFISCSVFELVIFLCAVCCARVQKDWCGGFCRCENIYVCKKSRRNLNLIKRAEKRFKCRTVSLTFFSHCST